MDNWFKYVLKKITTIIGISLCISACFFCFYILRKKDVTIDYLGHKYTVTTLANTVRTVINDKKIYIDDTYTVAPNLDTVLNKDTVISITKNEELAKINLDIEYNTDIEFVKIEEQKETINFPVEQKENDKLAKGQKKVLQKGEAGERVVVYRTVYKGDKEVKKDVLYEHRTEPILEKIEIGTKEAPAVTVSSGINVGVSEVELLASLIQAESGGEPYLGQVAVGAVCVNRVKSGKYRSIADVIYAPNQFCTVRKGMLKTVSPGSNSYRAAQEALGGVDPSNGALYFYNPRTASSSWSKSRPVTAKIGNHVFTK